MNTETKQKATPGPWRIGDAGNTVFGPPNGNPCPEIVAQSCKKNARLIATAPTLLECSIAAVHLLRNDWAEFGLTQDEMEVVTNLETAIAAATGGSTHD